MMPPSSFVLPWSTRASTHPNTLSRVGRLHLHLSNCSPSSTIFGLSNQSKQLQSSIDSNSVVLAVSSNTDALSTQDIVIGTILAFILALGYSYLNGQSSSTNFVSWQSQPPLGIVNGTSKMESLDERDINSRVFNETSWKEISRKEHYVLYNTRIREKQSPVKNASTRIDSSSDINSKQRENKLILFALLALFLPIFFIEIFFALSRQFICEGGWFGGNFEGDLAERLCSPIFRGI
jgi:uncharacterized integral membrane protein